MRLMPVIVTLLVTLAPGLALAQASAPALQAELEAEIAEVREAVGLVGAGGIILQGEDVLAISVSGERRKGSGELIGNDDLWHIGSITKSMTATMIGALVEEDMLDFDATLAEILPARSAQMDPGWRAVTLHQLLSHTAGAPANFGLTTQFLWPETAAEERDVRASQVEKILAAAPKSEPGTKFTYSNVGYTIAGYVAEQVSGETYEELMRSRVFEPMALASAGFGPPTGDNPWGHAKKYFFLKSAMDPNGRSDNTPVISPAGRVHLSLQDLAAYGRWHLLGEQGTDNVLNADTYRFLHKPVLSDYAAGWVVYDREWADGELIWHNGSNTMWYALLLILPEKDTVMAFTSNDPDFREAEQAFIGAARSLAAKLPPSGTREAE